MENHYNSKHPRVRPTEGDTSKMTEIDKKHARETLSKVKRTVSRAREPNRKLVGILKRKRKKGNDASRGELRREARSKKEEAQRQSPTETEACFLSISVILDLSTSVGRTRGCLEL